MTEDEIKEFERTIERVKAYMTKDAKEYVEHFITKLKEDVKNRSKST